MGGGVWSTQRFTRNPVPRAGRSSRCVPALLKAPGPRPRPRRPPGAEWDSASRDACAILGPLSATVEHQAQALGGAGGSRTHRPSYPGAQNTQHRQEQLRANSHQGRKPRGRTGMSDGPRPCPHGPRRAGGVCRAAVPGHSLRGSCPAPHLPEHPYLGGHGSLWPQQVTLRLPRDPQDPIQSLHVQRPQLSRLLSGAVPWPHPPTSRSPHPPPGPGRCGEGEPGLVPGSWEDRKGGVRMSGAHAADGPSRSITGDAACPKQPPPSTLTLEGSTSRH